MRDRLRYTQCRPLAAMPPRGSWLVNTKSPEPLGTVANLGRYYRRGKAIARLVSVCARSDSNFDVRPCLRKQTFQITKGPGECRMRFTTSSRFCGKSPLQHSQKILSSYAHIDYVDFIDKSLEMDFWDIVGAPLRCVVFFVTQQELPLPVSPQ